MIGIVAKGMKTFQHEWIFEPFVEHPTFFSKGMFGCLAAYLCRAADGGAGREPSAEPAGLTVGSIAYGDFQQDEWRTFAQEDGHPRLSRGQGQAFGTSSSDQTGNSHQ